MSIKDELTKDIELRLGGGMVDVELDSAHYDLAINQSLRKYRQRSSRAVAEKFIPIEIRYFIIISFIWENHSNHLIGVFIKII